MFISDSAVGMALLVLSESCEIKNESCRKGELPLILVIPEEGNVWITTRSGLMKTLSSFHQLELIPTSLC